MICYRKMAKMCYNYEIRFVTIISQRMVLEAKDMAKEASIEINCQRYSDRISEVIELLDIVGWSFFDEDENVEYLPLGDRGDYNWQMGETLTEGEVYSLIGRKQEHGEMVGVVMYYHDTDIGITLLAESTASIMIMLNINRKTVGEDFYEITDIGWYTEHIVHKLIRNGCPVDFFQYEEIEG